MRNAIKEYAKVAGTIVSGGLSGLIVAAVLMSPMVIAAHVMFGQEEAVASAPSPQAEPNAVITGPTESRPGDLVILKTEGSSGDSYSWQVYPPEAQTKYYAFEGGTVVVFASRTEGSVVFFLAVGGDDGKVSTTLHVLENRELIPDPDPDPPPPPPDVNPYQPASQWKALVEPVSKLTMSRADATTVAAMFDSVASSVVAGACSTTDKLRAMIVERGKPLGLKGKYADVAVAYEAILTKALSLEVKPLDKPEAAALLRSLAWATWEAGR